MSDRDTLSSIQTLVRSAAVRWLLSMAGTLGLAAWAYFGGLAKQADLDDLRQELHEVRAQCAAVETKSSADDLEAAAERAILHNRTKQSIAWQVRSRAAEAEPKRWRKAEAGKEAENEFKRLVDDGIDQVEAARRLLEW